MDTATPYTGKLLLIACEYSAMHLITTLEWLETAYLNDIINTPWTLLYVSISDVLQKDLHSR